VVYPPEFSVSFLFSSSELQVNTNIAYLIKVLGKVYAGVGGHRMVWWTGQIWLRIPTSGGLL
jgi:hypothetical protein